MKAIDELTADAFAEYCEKLFQAHDDDNTEEAKKIRSSVILPKYVSQTYKEYSSKSELQTMINCGFIFYGEQSLLTPTDSRSSQKNIYGFPDIKLILDGKELNAEDILELSDEQRKDVAKDAMQNFFKFFEDGGDDLSDLSKDIACLFDVLIIRLFTKNGMNKLLRNKTDENVDSIKILQICYNESAFRTIVLFDKIKNKHNINEYYKALENYNKIELRFVNSKAQIPQGKVGLETISNTKNVVQNKSNIQPNLQEFTDDEFSKLTEQFLELRKQGRFEESDKLIEQLHLIAGIANNRKERVSVKALIKSDANLSESEKKYGKNWIKP